MSGDSVTPEPATCLLAQAQTPLACLKLTTFIKHLHMLTILPTLAPFPLTFKEYAAPHGTVSVYDCGYVVCGLSFRDVAISHDHIGYC